MLHLPAFKCGWRPLFIMIYLIYLLHIKSLLSIMFESWHWFEWQEFKCPEKFALSLSHLFLGCARFELLGTIRESQVMMKRMIWMINPHCQDNNIFSPIWMIIPHCQDNNMFSPICQDNKQISLNITGFGRSRRKLMFALGYLFVLC